MYCTINLLYFGITALKLYSRSMKDLSISVGFGFDIYTNTISGRVIVTDMRRTETEGHSRLNTDRERREPSLRV